VATLNLQGQDGAWANRRAVLTDGLRDLRPDVVAFQDTIRTDDYDQAADLLGPDYHLAHPTTGRAPNGSGVEIASRWPIGETRELDLHLTPRVGDFPAMALVAEILTPDSIGPLLVINQRTSFWLAQERERELQAVATARLVEELVGNRQIHVVLTSDFNATPDAASLRFWRGRQSLDGMSVCYRDAWEHVHGADPGHTFTPTNPLVPTGNWPLELGRRIDYILVRCCIHGPTLDIVDCRRMFDEPVGGVWATDHFGVAADLAVLTSDDPCWNRSD
jgi:endonuclease/exonuclease/phosphatase family metal-dependent hydrolase